MQIIERKATSRNEAGTVIMTLQDGGVVESATLQCVHCGTHWLYGSDKTVDRGYCGQCQGPVCGRKCAKCIPQEQWLENVEKGRDEDFRPTVQSVIWTP